MNNSLIKFRDSQLQIHINDLTEDCFLVIFSLLTNIREKLRLRRVCKRWRHVIEKSLIYHHTKLTRVQDVYYENEIRNLQNSIDSLNCDNHMLSDELFYRYRISLSKIFTNYINLKVFHIIKNPTLVNCQFDWNLKDDNLPNFSLLEIRIVNDDQMTDELLSTLVNKCPKLDTIEIVNCFNVNGDFLFYIISHLKNLRLDRCQIDTKKLNNWIFNGGRNLRSLSISCRSVEIRLILPSINQICDQIKELNLKNQILITFPISTWKLIGNLKLKKLTLSNLLTLNDEIFLSILNQNLEHLELELQEKYIDTSDKLTCFQSFKKCCPLLKHLQLINIQTIDMIYFYCLIELTNLDTIIFVNSFRLSNLFIDFLKEAKSIKKLILCQSLKPEDVDKQVLIDVCEANKIELVVD